ncbi:MAG: hypothetical protein AAGA99_00625 [Actinomycetota bacterium]
MAGQVDASPTEALLADAASRRFSATRDRMRGGRFDTLASEGATPSVEQASAASDLIAEFEENVGLDPEQGEWRVAGVEDTPLGMAVELEVPAGSVTDELVRSSPSPQPRELDELTRTTSGSDQVVRVDPDGAFSVYGGEKRNAWPSSAKDSSGRPLLRPRTPARVADASQIRTAHGTVLSQKLHRGLGERHPAFDDSPSLVLYTTDPGSYRQLVQQLATVGERPDAEILMSTEGFDAEGGAASLAPVVLRFEDEALLAQAWEMLEGQPGLAERVAYTDSAPAGASAVSEHHVLDEIGRHYTWYGQGDGPNVTMAYTDRPATVTDRPDGLVQSGEMSWAGRLPIDDPSGTLELDPAVVPEHPLDGAAIRVEGRGVREGWLLPGPSGLRMSYTQPPVPAPRVSHSGDGFRVELPAADADGNVDPLLFDEVSSTLSLAGLQVTEWGTN